MKFLYFLVMGILLWSCSSLKMEKASDITEIKSNAVVYQIPQNEIQINFELTELSYTSGLFSEYSKIFLEVEPLKNQSESAWCITDVSINSKLVDDSSQVYIISGAIDKIHPANLLQITRTKPVVNNQQELHLDSPDNYLPNYTEISLKKLIIEQSKTSYKTVTVDSVTKRIPVMNTVVRNKTKKEMAKDASKTLAKIRKRKFRLMAGLNEKMPKAGALKIMIDELDKKEAYYLSLFMGVEERTTKNISFSVLPTNFEKHLLFSFDKEKGIHQDTLINKQVWLSFEEDNSGNECDLSSKYKNTEKLFPYRKPQVVDVLVLRDEKPIAKMQTSISQFGAIRYLPLDLLKTTKISIE